MSGRAEAPQSRSTVASGDASASHAERPVASSESIRNQTRRDCIESYQREEQVQAEAERKIRELDNKLYREEQMEKFWNFVTILGLCYVLMRLSNARNWKRDARRHEKSL